MPARPEQDNPGRPWRVAIVTNGAAPYRFPVWNSLAQHVESLHVLLCVRREANRCWDLSELERMKFKPVTLPGFGVYIHARDMGLYWNPSIFNELRRINPTHIVTTGYEVPTYMAALAYAKLRRIPVVVWWGSHALSSRSRRGPVAWLRRFLLRRYDAYVTYGTRSSRYLLDMGISSELIVTGTNTVDVRRVAAAVGPRDTDDQRSDRPVRFLYVGQLIERKGVVELLRAFSSIPPSQATLTIVGYGPQEAALKEYARSIAAPNVSFAGPTRTVEQTAEYLRQSDVLVMPSLIEVWGLVVNEALAAGLYVLSSKQAGATQDLIIDAPFEVGRAIDPTNLGELEAILRETIDKVRAGQINRANIAAWGLSHTPEKYARAVCKALEVAGRFREHQQEVL